MEETPFEDRRVPKSEVDWERSFWWWIPLTRAIHPAAKLTTPGVGTSSSLASAPGRLDRQQPIRA